MHDDKASMASCGTRYSTMKNTCETCGRGSACVTCRALNRQPAWVDEPQVMPVDTYINRNLRQFDQHRELVLAHAHAHYRHDD